MHRRALLWLSLASLAASGSACSGGSSSAGHCESAPAPASGPGDTQDYFPAEIGWSWQYQQSSGLTATVTVTGTQQVGAETASVLFSSSFFGLATSTDLVVKRPWGVYALDDGTADQALVGTFPQLVLPFPAAASPTAELVRCTSVDAGDLDEDGQSERAYVVQTLSVISTSETTSVPAGTFTDVVHVRRDLEVIVHATSRGTLTVVGSLDDWYASGVGRVQVNRTMGLVGDTADSVTSQLTSYVAPTAGVAGPVSAAREAPPSLGATHHHEAATFEAAARRLADSMLGGLR